MSAYLFDLGKTQEAEYRQWGSVSLMVGDRTEQRCSSACSDEFW